MKFIPKKLATTGIIVILSSILIFHLLIVIGVIPYDIVWGGKLESEEQMMQLELVSLIINASLLFAVISYSKDTKKRIKPVIFKIIFWLMTILFAVNTLGNLLSENILETIIFTPLTLILSLFSLRLALEK